MPSAFVVDDERMARGNLIDALGQHPRWRVLSEYASGATLVADAMARHPDVIFLDIQMPGDDGLALARQLLALKPAPLIVFVTAHSEYAVTAFELYAVDYLLKPFDDARFAQCVARLEHTLRDASALTRAQTAQAAWATTAPLERIVIKSSTSVRIIDVDDVAWFQANGNYVDIHHADGVHL
ncbi:MAG: response regulator, partial [Pseudomonadota bacterium]